MTELRSSHPTMPGCFDPSTTRRAAVQPVPKTVFRDVVTGCAFKATADHASVLPTPYLSQLGQHAVVERVHHEKSADRALIVTRGGSSSMSAMLGTASASATLRRCLVSRW